MKTSTLNCIIVGVAIVLTAIIIAFATRYTRAPTYSFKGEINYGTFDRWSGKFISRR